MKKRISKIALTIISLFICSISFAQVNFKKTQIKGANYFAVLADNEKQVAALVNEKVILKQITKNNELFEFRFESSFTDDLKYTHKKFSAWYNGIPIQGMDFVIHEKESIVKYVNGTYENIENIAVKPSISEPAAISYAQTYFGANVKINAATKLRIENKGFCIIKNPLLVNSKYELAYKILIDPNTVSGKYIFVSAINGSIINYENLVCTTNAPGTAQTRYSSTQNFTTDQQGSQYRLREVRNGVNIKTLNANYESDVETIVSGATDFWDTNDNNWTVAEHGANQVATDAHWATEKTYDYWLNTHNRNSINNAGMDITSYIHVGSGYDNAFWRSDKNAMFYGDGATFFLPLTAIDVCAHELGHGICQYTSNLSYASGTESMALNEGFSDIWGASVEAYAAPTKQRWLIGEEITLFSPGYLRSMSNPPSGAFIPSPDTYGDANWNNESDGHYRSGVLNKWYYLLSEGASGTNGIGNAYNVSGITISKAEKIAYRTEQLLNSNANYAMARTISIQAVQELYGVNSCEEKAVTDAWYAVGVGAAFTGNVTYAPVITGNGVICGINSTQNYTINLPVGATATWSANASVSITPITSNGSEVTVTNVSAYGATTYLTAVVNSSQTGGCNPVPGTYTAYKQLVLGSPGQYSFTPYITQNGNTTYMSSYCNLITGTCGPNNLAGAKTGSPNPNIISPYSYCASGYITDATSSSITWSVYQTNAGTFHGFYSFNANQFEVSINANYVNEWIVLKCTRTNGCGSADSYYKFYAVQPPGGSCGNPPPSCYPNCPTCTSCEPFADPNVSSAKISIYPNPGNGQFNVALKTTDKSISIKEIIIKNKMGLTVYQKKISNNQPSQLVDIYGTPTDLYTVQVFDGKTWQTQKIIIQQK